MKSDLVKEELTNLLSTLTEQFETMNAHENNIPQIEVDIFLKNIQVLYENATFLKKINNTPLKQEVEEKVVAPAEIKEEIVHKEEIIEEVNSQVTEEIIAEEKESIKEPQKEEIMELPLPKSFETPEHIASSFDDILEEVIPEKDLFSHVKASQEILDLNKKLAEARGNHTLVEKLQNQQIDSLKAVIGINDKFYFINELFDGDAHKYEDVIYTLNNFKKLDDAMQYFSTLKYRFSWTEDLEASEKLIHMLERKFNIVKA